MDQTILSAALSMQAVPAVSTPLVVSYKVVGKARTTWIGPRRSLLRILGFPNGCLPRIHNLIT